MNFRYIGLDKKFHIPAEELSQFFCRIYRKFKVLIFAISMVNLICLGIMIPNLTYLKSFHILDTLGPIQKFRISAEELSQLFCRIHRKL